MKKQKPLSMPDRKRRDTKFHHGLITVTAVIFCMFLGIVRFGSGPQVPLVCACLCAGLMAFHLGYSWNDILQGM
ncbi:MAG: hypothetical protein J6S83_01970, partial [Lachnospiraceae bacterium]|nr:hypothetical protein [Lachnospiraceae bacterium]